MWAVIGATIQLLLLIFQKTYKDAEAKKEEQKKDAKDAIEAIDSGDLSALNAVIDRLRE